MTDEQSNETADEAMAEAESAAREVPEQAADHQRFHQGFRYRPYRLAVAIGACVYSTPPGFVTGAAPRGRVGAGSPRDCTGTQVNAL